MTTAYVVTQGSYSDYRIVKVFLDKERAQRFLDIFSKSSYDEVFIEEYEVEEREAKPLYVSVLKWYSISNESVFKIKEFADTDVDSNYQSNSSIYWGGFPDFHGTVELQRVFYTTPDKEKLETRLMKVAQDIWAQVQEKTQVEGLTIDQVNQWLKGLPIEGGVSEET